MIISALSCRRACPTTLPSMGKSHVLEVCDNLCGDRTKEYTPLRGLASVVQSAVFVVMCLLSMANDPPLKPGLMSAHT